MNLAATFETLANQWCDYCESIAGSSNLNDRLNHPSYHQLIALGSDAVPFAMQRLIEDNDAAPWEFVLQELTGVRIIEDPNQINFEAARAIRQQWWLGQQGGQPQDHPQQK